MPVVGYCYGIRSEWRLCEEVHLNLAYRWFCRLGLEDEVPNHSTFSKNRHSRSRIPLGVSKGISGGTFGILITKNTVPEPYPNVLQKTQAAS